jgi:GTP-binding protein
MQAFSDAEFLRAVGRPGELPPAGPPEVAFAGRSNVGKSSAINALVGRHRLARTSKTPGRTQTINFYGVGGERDARLVDLPGYGFARVPQPLRIQWEKLVSAYLQDRPSLAGVVVIMDARHPLTPLDRQLLGWLAGSRTLALLSKADKLGRADQAAVLKEVRASLACEVMLFSSTSKQGVEECRARLAEWLDEAARENKKPPAKGM